MRSRARAARRQQPGGLLALADRVRRALTGRGVAQNEPVHVRIGNRASDLGALLGVWQAGAVVVPVHASAAPSTVERVQRASRARFSIDGDRFDVLDHSAPPDRALLRDAALVIFTSGSTGEPKGVVIGHRRLADKLAILDRLLKIRSNDVVLSPLQLTFIFGLWVSLLALMKGARLVLVPKFTSDAIGRCGLRNPLFWPACRRCFGLCWRIRGEGTEPPFDSYRRRGACTRACSRHDAPRAWCHP